MRWRLSLPEPRSLSRRLSFLSRLSDSPFRMWQYEEDSSPAIEG